MEPQNPTRKRTRKPPPRSHVDGALTRSKSMVHSRLTRSGLCRSESVNHNADTVVFLRDRKRKARLSDRDGEICGGAEEMGRISVKDLRARRIFSQPLEDDRSGRGDQDCGEKGGFQGEGDEIEKVGDGNHISSIQNVTNSVFEDGEVRLEDLSSELCAKKSSIGVDDPKLKGDEACDIGKEEEEDIQTTPPPAAVDDSFAEQRDAADEGKKDLEHRDPATEIPIPLKECQSNNDGCGKDNSLSSDVDRLKDSGFMRKPVLKPCSKLKIYKAPTSFSYRRLLPYLMDIAKNRTCEVQTAICPKGGKHLEEKPLQHSTVSAPKESYMGKGVKAELPVPLAESVIQVTTNASGEVERFFSEQHAISTTQQSVVRSPINGSPRENLVATERSPLLSETSVGGSLKVDPAPSHKLGDMDSGLKNMSPVVGSDEKAVLSSNGKGLETSMGEATLYITRSSADCAVGESSKGGADLRPVTIDDVAPAKQPRDVPAKGILKRNPQGCKGLCTCLDCTSFRLHATRAFEFSRNQTQDTEELAFHLMKELSSLRNMLEKSVDSATSAAILPVHQIKEACGKASEAETLARKRLRQMKEDLFVHCRVKLSKVDFPSRIGEQNSCNSHLKVVPAKEM